jgi:hypothetical protein
MVRYKLHLPSWYMTNIKDGLFYVHHSKKLFILRKNEYAHDVFNKCHKLLLVNMFQYYSMYFSIHGHILFYNMCP